MCKPQCKPEMIVLQSAVGTISRKSPAVRECCAKDPGKRVVGRGPTTKDYSNVAGEYCILTGIQSAESAANTTTLPVA